MSAEDKGSPAPTSGPPIAGLLVAYTSVGIDMLGLSIILPVIPFYAVQFNASPFMLGMIFAIYGAAQTPALALSGYLSDTFGRRPMILLSLGGSATGFLCQGLSPSLEFFMASRAVAGIFGGSIPISQAYIADVTTREERPKYLAMMGSIIALSFMFGPGMGAGLSKFSLQTPMFVSAGLAAIGWLLALFAFEEPVRINEISNQSAAGTKDGAAELKTIEIEMTDTVKAHNTAEKSRDASDFEDVEVVTDRDGEKEDQGDKGEEESLDEKEATDAEANGTPARSKTATLEAEKEAQAALAQIKEDQAKRAAEREATRAERHRPVIYIIWCCAFLNYIGFASYISMYGLMIKDKFGWGTLEYGFISTAGGFIAIVSQVAGFNNLHPVIGKHGAGIVGFSCSTVALGCVAAFDPTWIGARACTLVATSILSAGIALTNPSISTTLSDHASASTQGQTLGVSQALQAMARVVGPLLFGYLYEVAPVWPFLAGAISTSLGLILMTAAYFQNAELEALEKKEEADEGEQSLVDDSVPEDMLMPVDHDKAADIGEFVWRLLVQRGYEMRTFAQRTKVKAMLYKQVPVFEDEDKLLELGDEDGVAGLKAIMDAERARSLSAAYEDVEREFEHLVALQQVAGENIS